MVLSVLMTKILTITRVLLAGVLDDIGDAIESVGAWITSLITAMIPIFWDATATTPTFTFIGWLTVVGFCLGLVFAIIRLIRSFVRI